MDASEPFGDRVFDPASFEKYLTDRIKVNNKTGNLGDKVVISRKNAVVTVATIVPMSKAYLKFLTKKYLKKNQLRDYLRVTATEKRGYVLKYFKTGKTESA